MNHYKLIIFDWDGTVMDSVARIVSSMRAAAKDVGLPIPMPEQVKNIIGLSLPEANNILFPTKNAEQELLLIERYKKHYTELDNTPTPLFDHATQLFSDLLARNKYLAVATGKGRDGLERIFKATGTKHFFHSSRCAKECQSKPHPDMIEQILAELDVKPEDAVMIGDTIHDMGMAQNANVDRIGVTFGVHDRQTLNEFSPVATVDSYQELHALLVK